MKKILSVFQLCVTLVLPSLAANKTDPFLINPVVTNFEGSIPLNNNFKIYLGEFIDNTSSKNTGIVGRTRTGIKTTAPIIIRPSLAASIRKSFESYLQKNGNLSNDPTTATFELNLFIEDCTMIESSSFLSQTLASTIKVEAKLIDPLQADKVRSFIIESTSSNKAMDTSKYAEDTMKDVIKNVISEFCNTVNKY